MSEKKTPLAPATCSRREPLQPDLSGEKQRLARAMVAELEAALTHLRNAGLQAWHLGDHLLCKDLVNCRVTIGNAIVHVRRRSDTGASAEAARREASGSPSC